ncbi:hypothetical protein VH569_35105, partial [Azospirillum sp. 11R-A]|uniref:hypothetical protein n=1 Tax=Azospirillum sp. 11R-A TaxID=3111634 RepID=UPI003C1F30AF
ILGAASKGGRSVIARVLTTEPVYARLDRAEPELWAAMRQAQPNFFLPFDRHRRPAAGGRDLRHRRPRTVRRR